MKKTGFTLLETMIATVILASVLGALAFSLNLSSRLRNSAHNQDTALTAVQSKLEEISNSHISSIISNYNNKEFNVTGLTSPTTGHLPGKITVTQISGTGLYNVKVTAKWKEQPNKVLSKSVNAVFINK